MTATPVNSEWLTRKQLIDKMLLDAGWTSIVPFVQGKALAEYGCAAVEEYETANGPADYVLVVDGRIIGVVEAKKLTLGPQNVLSQAERYAKGIRQLDFSFGEFGVPFLYSTNGEVIWHHDIRYRLSRSRQISHFHTPDALREQLHRDFDSSIDQLRITPNAGSRLRSYQLEANQAIEEALENRKRHMLVAMATGTGKTFTMVNEVYRLMKSGAAKRVLFLVDRRALAAQAVRAFASYDAEQGLKFDQVYEVYSQRFQRDDIEESFDPRVLPNTHLTQPSEGKTFVYVSTIQRMAINLFGRDAAWAGEDGLDDDAEELEIPIHAFDLIIADECHRGYTSSDASMWRKTLEHFDAVKIGLTATPAAHTTAYFKDVVYRYDYERAVREGFLVDYDLVTIKSNVRMNGIFLHEGEEVGVVNPESGAQTMDTLEDERQFETTQIERDITAPDSNRKILEEVRKYAIEHEQRYGRFPKTLIFATNDLPHTSHADQLVDIARDIFGQGDVFVQKITGSPTVDRPLQRIREFRNRPNPAIVVTVDMLSTGVDIPDLEFIVFLRPVKSRILFEQMMGRGTRRGERYADKSHFTVFDCFDGTLIEYFRNATGITAEEPVPPTKTIRQLIDDIWANRDRAYNVRCLVRRMQRIDKEMSGEARAMFAAYVPEGDLAQFAADLERMLAEQFTPTMSLLRREEIVDLLVNYPRKPKIFFVAHGTEDEVLSQWLVRGLDGKEYKPEDYLIAFHNFVSEHKETIEAIRILLQRPKDWKPSVLIDLRKVLAESPQRFTVENLQKAHELMYKKALVDIISMVKHAINEQSPLLSAAERVDKAFTQLSLSAKLTAEQQQWLDRIRVHMQENLSIDKEDFELQPVFARYGGWRKANSVFNNKLEGILQEVNAVIAA